MKFVHREIHAFEDAQRNFEQLEPLVSSGGSDTVTAALARANLGLPDSTGRAPFIQTPMGAMLAANVNWGSATATWGGGAQASATVTQAHGLGKTPTQVWLTCFQAAVACWAQLIAAPGGTNIQFVAEAPSLPVNGTTVLIYWLVIG